MKMETRAGHGDEQEVSCWQVESKRIFDDFARIGRMQVRLLELGN